MAKQTYTNNKYTKAAMKHIANGHSVETLVSWWNRLVDQAEVKDGKVFFYLPEPKSTGHRCYSFTLKKVVALELPVW